MKRRRSLAALAALAASASRVATGAPTPGPLGQRVDWPPLTLTDGRVLAPADWADTAAVLVFWATWCPFCRRHNAHIERLYREAAGPHLRVLGVALDAAAPAVARYMQTNGYSFPVVAGEPALRDRFTPRRVIPMTCLVDRQGVLRQCIPGEMAEDDVLALARLAQPAPLAALPASLPASLSANKMQHG